MKFGTFVAALVVAVVAPSVTSFASPDCRASRELLDLGHPLTVAREAVAKDHELRIVAMGSSSTQGYGTTSPQFAYPAQLKLHLEKAMPGVAVHVVNKGIGGQDAEEMTERMKSDVQPSHAQLVIWQVGTNSAIRHTPLDLFSRKLRAGIDIGRSLGAEFILMNLQYVPAVVALPDEQDYAHVMAQVAKEKGTGLFNRLSIMKAWYNDGMPYSQFVYNDGLHLNDFGQKCIGKLLSQAILRTVKPSQLTGDPKAGN